MHDGWCDKTMVGLGQKWTPNGAMHYECHAKGGEPSEPPRKWTTWIDFHQIWESTQSTIFHWMNYLLMKDVILLWTLLTLITYFLCFWSQSSAFAPDSNHSSERLEVASKTYISTVPGPLRVRCQRVVFLEAKPTLGTVEEGGHTETNPSSFNIYNSV